MTYPRKLLILSLGICLFFMLSVSIWQRFHHPRLTVVRMEGKEATQNEIMAGIGKYMEAAARNPQDRETLLALVENLLAIGQFESAENFAQKALALDKAGEEDSRALYLLAVAHHNQGRHAEAADLLEKLLARSNNPSARYSLGILYIHYLHKPLLGIEHLEKGLQAPNLSPALAKTIGDELASARALLPALNPDSQSQK